MLKGEQLAPIIAIWIGALIAIFGYYIHGIYEKIKSDECNRNIDCNRVVGSDGSSSIDPDTER